LSERWERSAVEKCHAAALVVDDDPGVRQSLRLCLDGSFDRVLGVGTPAGAIEAASRAHFDVVLLDAWLGATSGLSLLPLLARRPGTAVIVLGADASYEPAVEAMRLGATDYLPKPLCPGRVRAAVRRVIDERCEERPSVEPRDAGAFLETTSPTFRAFLATAERAASSDCVVLLRGESGTGKNVMAEWIHARSRRRGGPFVAVNCPSLAGELMATTLFGHRKGSFTGAVADAVGKVQDADGGTLFLDEIGDLGLEAQARVLRFLHDRSYERVGDARQERADVRIVAATNRDLGALVRAGAFREDLLYRLDVISLALPALRDRGQADLLSLARHFLREAAARNGRPGTTMSEAAWSAIAAHRWPGNLRELRHAVERGVVLAPNDRIEPEDLGLSRAEAGAPGDRPAPALGAEVALEEIEREHIARVVARAVSLDAAARLLGIDTTTLQRKRRRYGLA